MGKRIVKKIEKENNENQFSKDHFKICYFLWQHCILFSLPNRIEAAQIKGHIITCVMFAVIMTLLLLLSDLNGPNQK